MELILESHHIIGILANGLKISQRYRYELHPVASEGFQAFSLLNESCCNVSYCLGFCTASFRGGKTYLLGRATLS